MEQIPKEHFEQIYAALPTIITGLANLSAPPADQMEITLSQLRTLEILSERGMLTLHELAELSRVAQSSTSEMVDRLVRSRLVNRRRDTRDRRTLQISITENGRRLLERKKNLLAQKYEHIIQKLENQEREEFQKAISSLFKIFHEEV